MNKILIAIAIFFAATQITAQHTQINLEQSPKAFTTSSLVLEAGSYQFNISNKDVNHDVGFVLVPKGKYEASDHIKEAYVKSPVSQGASSETNIVKLAAGEYEYFCPLNPTPKYSLVVHENVETITLKQQKGAFDKTNLSVKEGVYKFDVHNVGVDHEVGFVLVPKGKYAPENHIKPAYVKAPVANGDHSETNIVNLHAGEYEYFCPLNPTPKYSLTVSK